MIRISLYVCLLHWIFFNVFVSLVKQEHLKKCWQINEWMKKWMKDEVFLHEVCFMMHNPKPCNVKIFGRKKVQFMRPAVFVQKSWDLKTIAPELCVNVDSSVFSTAKQPEDFARGVGHCYLTTSTAVLQCLKHVLFHVL